MDLSVQGTDREAESFTYTSLDLSQRSIRLIRVLPHLSPNGHIQCKMYDATVDDRYTGLSYVWGPPDNGYPVMINGQLHHVRSNLSGFLQCARNDYWRVLWIDALCIDQENLAEITHQVQQMGLIYSQARNVVSWLGTSPDIIDFFRQISDGLPVGNEQPNVQKEFCPQILDSGMGYSGSHSCK
jgi:hypothetical protein